MSVEFEEINQDAFRSMDIAIYSVGNYLRYMSDLFETDKPQVTEVLKGIRKLEKDLPELDQKTREYVETYFMKRVYYHFIKKDTHDERIVFCYGTDSENPQKAAKVIFDNRNGPFYMVPDIKSFVEIAKNELVRLAFYSVSDESSLPLSYRNDCQIHLLRYWFRSRDVKEMIAQMPERKKELSIVLKKVVKREEAEKKRNREFD